MMDCPECWSDNTEYLGIDDGAGDYGDALADQYACRDCGAVFDGAVWADIPPSRFGGIDDGWFQTVKTGGRNIWRALRWHLWERWRVSGEDLPF